MQTSVDVNIPLHSPENRLRARFLKSFASDLCRLGLPITVRTSNKGFHFSATNIPKDNGRLLELARRLQEAQAEVNQAFRKAIEEKYRISNAPSFPAGITSLWKAMNDGSSFGFLGKLLRFNGGLFADQQALPLTQSQLERLKEAAHCNWADVEPAIFGTLLERALDPRERHRLGAHYTPRSYVERLVRPTIEEPLRADWDLVRAEVRRLVEDGKVDDAQKAVRTFHRRLTKTRVLDPACGSGNFLYVSLDLFKRLESEILSLLRDLGEKQDLLEIEGATVTPEQFRGIEVKRWAKEIAELVLWIGYIQWQVRTHGSAKAIPEPVLRDYGNIEYRDAVLAYDRKELVVDEKGVPVTRWDGITYKTSPVTGEDIPDDRARVPIYQYVNPRKAEWPEADFVVGNPPFIGGWRIRQALGDGYVEALWKANPHISEKADYVMYWWDKAAELVLAGKISRFGFITTNSIGQVFQRRVLAHHMAKGLSILWAIPDHAWVDSESGAAVRIAMTVGSAKAPANGIGTLATVVTEVSGDDETVQVTFLVRPGVINSDLTIGVDVTKSNPLRANAGICSPGVQLYGSGFIVSQEEAWRLGFGVEPGVERHIRPYRNGRDLTDRPRDVLVIDCYDLSEEDLRQHFPSIYQHLLIKVKPERDLNRRQSIQAKWWRFGWERPAFRHSILGLRRYIEASVFCLSRRGNTARQPIDQLCSR